MKKSDNISDILRHVPCKEAKHLFSDTPAITKLLDLPSNSGKYADEVVDAFKRVADRDSLGLFESFIKNNNFKDVADYEKRYTKIISNVSEFQDELMLVIKNADERTALKISEFASDYGKGVIGAVDKCGYDNIYKITHYISESGVSGKVASELFEALSKHGDTLIKAVEKCGPKNIENIVEILSKINPNQVDAVIDLLVHHGDDLVKAICKCGDEYTDLIIRCVSHEKFAGDVATHFLKAMSDHSDTMIKAIGRCGADNFDTIADYSKIFDRFGVHADELFLNGERVFGEFVGLDRAFESSAKAICFASTKAGDKCFVTVSGVYTYNRTITVSEDVAKELRKIDSISAVTNSEKIEKGKLFTKVYNDLLTDEYLKTITDPDIQHEYKKLVDAISQARLDAIELKKYSVADLTGIVGERSFEKERSIINCAEVWAAREHILAGGKFDELFITTRHFNQQNSDFGSLFCPCKNCQHTFINIISQLDR